MRKVADVINFQFTFLYVTHLRLGILGFGKASFGLGLWFAIAISHKICCKFTCFRWIMTIFVPSFNKSWNNRIWVASSSPYSCWASARVSSNAPRVSASASSSWRCCRSLCQVMARRLHSQDYWLSPPLLLSYGGYGVTSPGNGFGRFCWRSSSSRLLPSLPWHVSKTTSCDVFLA